MESHYKIIDGLGFIKISANMTEYEKINFCIELSVHLLNIFNSIEKKHQIDSQEMCRDIHDIQNILFSIAHKQDIKINNQL